MPSSRYLISSQTLGSAAASVTFSSIPATYTDLVLRVSARGDDTAIPVLQMEINSATSGYSNTLLRGNGSTATSTRSTGQTYLRVGFVNNSGMTASSFGSTEIYIPSYTTSVNKPISAFSVTETNATAADILAFASLSQTASAITQIVLSMAASGQNFVTGSSFYLYGLKNS